MSVTEELKVKVRADTASAVRELDKLKTVTTGNTTAFAGMAKTLVGFGGVAVALAGFKRLVVDNITEGIRYAAALETQAVAFEVLLGSAGKATVLMKEIQEFAASTPFQLPELQSAAQRLLGFGSAAEEVVGTMRMLGDLSMGNAGILDRLTLAYGKLQAKGKATLEELNMFTEAGVPLMNALAESLDTTTENLFKMISQGEVSFADVQRAMVALTSQGGQFFDMTARQAETLSGVMSTFKDNVDDLRGALVQSFLPAMKESVGELTKFVQLVRESRTVAGLDFTTLKGGLQDILGGSTSQPGDVALIETLIQQLSPEGYAQLTTLQKTSLGRVFQDVAPFDPPGPFGPPTGRARGRASIVDQLEILLNSVQNALETQSQAAVGLIDAAAGTFGATAIEGTKNFRLQGREGQSKRQVLRELGLMGTAADNRTAMGGFAPGRYGYGSKGIPFAGGSGGTSMEDFFRSQLAQLSMPEFDVSGVFGGTQTTGLPGGRFPSLGPMRHGVPSEFTDQPYSMNMVSALDTAIASIGVSIQDVFAGSGFDALQKFGRELANGATGAEAMRAGLQGMAMMLAEQLPQMLLAAGVQAVVSGNVALGAGLIALALGGQIIGGYVSQGIANNQSEAAAERLEPNPEPVAEERRVGTTIIVNGDINDAERFEAKVLSAVGKMRSRT